MCEYNILLMGEGSTDYGIKDYNTGEWKQGPAVVYINKCVELFGKNVSIVCLEKAELKEFRLQMRRMSGLSGKAKDSYKFASFARHKGYKYAIFYCDADKEQGENNTTKHRCQKRFEDVYQEIRNGFDALNGNIALMPMVALKMIECWLMADSNTYKILYGETPSNPTLPNEPELIWGNKDDPRSNYPKNYLKRVLCGLSRFHDGELNRELFVSIAENANIETLKEKCPISFMRFYEDLQNLLM